MSVSGSSVVLSLEAGCIVLAVVRRSLATEGGSGSAVFGDSVAGSNTGFLDLIDSGVSHEELLSGCYWSNKVSSNKVSLFPLLLQKFLLSFSFILLFLLLGLGKSSTSVDMGHG